jgi:hypothetical protein
MQSTRRGGGAEALARQVSDSYGPAFQRHALLAALFAVVWTVVPSLVEAQTTAGAPDAAARDALQAARTAYGNGDLRSALEILRRLRAGPADPSSIVDSYALSARYTLSLGDEYTARYFLRRLLDTAPGSAEAFQTSILLARHCYDTRSWSASLEYYLDAVSG